MGDLSDWTRAELERGGWIRRMFAEGRRQRAEFGDDAVADLSIGQPLEATEGVRAAFRAAAAEEFPGRHAYMPNSGYPEVRERAAEDVGFDGVSAKSITITPGAAAAITLALRAFVEPGSRVLGVAPYFAEFRLYVETHGSSFEAVAVLPDLSIDLEALEAALQHPAAALILNSPCNPTGHVLTDAELRGVASLLSDHHRRHGRHPLLVIDEVYRRLVYPPAVRAEPFSFYPHAVLARSFSKDLGLAGERIGYLACHPEMDATETERGIELAARALGFVNAPATAQRALLQLPSWEVDLGPYRQRRDRAVAAVRDAGLDYHEPQGGLYLWVRSPEPTLEYVMRLAERHVLVTPGVAFGDEAHFRLCFSQPLPALDLAAREFQALAARA